MLGGDSPQPPTETGQLHLAIVLDVFSRKVAGWAMATAWPRHDLEENTMKQRFTGALAAGLITATTAGCATMSENETAGTILGGVAGAVVGNQFGKGSGKTVATALGAIIGATAGRNIGKSLDATSQVRAGAAARQALDTAAVGESITWENPANASGPARGSATVTRQGNDSGGRTCREFQQTVTIAGRQEQSYGTACRDQNGDWKLAT